MTHHRVTLAAIALTLMAATGAVAQDTGFGAGTPESRYFRIDATVTAGRRGPQLEGYVYNVYDAHALRVRLNVEAIDAAGRLIEKRVAYVPLDGRGRARRRRLSDRVPARRRRARRASRATAR